MIENRPFFGQKERAAMFHIIGSLIMGALVGTIAGKLMDSEGSLIRSILIGIVGSAVGSAVFGLIGFRAYGWIANLIVDVAGACLFIWVGRKLFR